MILNDVPGNLLPFRILSKVKWCAPKHSFSIQLYLKKTHCISTNIWVKNESIIFAKQYGIRLDIIHIFYGVFKTLTILQQ